MKWKWWDQVYDVKKTPQFHKLQQNKNFSVHVHKSSTNISSLGLRELGS